MKLFGFKGTRSNRVEWMLQELGVTYDFVKVDLLTGEHKTADHVRRHGHGLVPALEDGNVRMIESAAACLYLADTFADKKLAPAVSPPERARTASIRRVASASTRCSAAALAGAARKNRSANCSSGGA